MVVCMFNVVTEVARAEGKRGISNIRIQSLLERKSSH